MSRQRRQTARWVVLALAAITVFAVVSAWLTAPRLGGRMDPEATSPLGAHALVTLLRDHDVEVVVAATVADVQRAGRPDTLLLIAETANTRGAALTDLAAVPGDRLVVEPTATSRGVLTPELRLNPGGGTDDEPGCGLHEAEQAGRVAVDSPDTYEQATDIPLTRCYGGALVRYTAGDRTTTVVGTSEFMTNAGLLREGNAALALNLAGQRSRLIWYAPQHIQGDTHADRSLTDLIPASAKWVAIQLVVVVGLLALWQGRRLGPLVPERLPVVVRASETVEGRARLYRSSRARGPAAQALRSASLRRLTPRLGLGPNASENAVVAAAAVRCGVDEATAHRVLFGPAPDTDTDLFQLARALDEFERQVRS